MKEYSKAVETLSQIMVRDTSDLLFFQKMYETGLCMYLSGQYESAISTLDLIEGAGRRADTCVNVMLVNALSENCLYRFNEAGATLKKITVFLPDDQRSAFADGLQRVYLPKNRPKYHKPELAKNLSMVLPGLGQAYVGRVGEGSISFLLNLSALTFGLYHIYYGYYFSGYIIGFSLLNKFHSGGMSRSEILAEAKNGLEMQRFNEEVVSYVEKHSKGLSHYY